MTSPDILLIADIPCRPTENLMTLLTMFSPVFSVILVLVSRFLSWSINWLKLPTAAAAFVTSSFPKVFFPKAEMDVFLPLATLKALFWGMCLIWTQQSMCVTLIVGPVSSFWLQESFTSEQLKNFTLDTGAFGSGWRGASLTRYFETCRMDSSVLGVDSSHVFIFQWR